MLPKNTVMIYLILVHYMKPRTQITQERWEYDITTKSAKFIQQNISSLSEGNNSVYNLYLLQYM